MAKFPMTEKWLRGLAAQRPDRCKDWFDEGVRLPGVALVLRHGLRTLSWAVRYRSPADGAVRVLRIGRYPEMKLQSARAVARQKTDLLLRGFDPSTHVREESIPTTAETMVAFIEHCRQPDTDGRARVKSWKLYAWRLGVQIAEDDGLQATGGLSPPPEWLGMSLVEIESKMVRTAIARVREERGEVTAEQWRKTLHTMFGFALSRGWIDANPAKGLASREKKNVNHKVLTRDQACTIFRAAGEIDSPTARALQWMLLTGQRAATVVRSQWEQFEDDWWHIPKDLLKTKDYDHLIYVGSPLAQDLLAHWRATKHCDRYVFPSQAGRPLESSASLAGPVAKIREATGIGEFMAKLCRPSAATIMTEVGVELQHVALALHHAVPGVPAITRRHYVNNAEFRRLIRAAYEAYHGALAEHLNSLSP